ncbi:hypothetical protein DL93DRAFT_2089101 [Clavulina sp. PMI_390]|nr:hypothetical protein DL93DRAFT_2089101 [Clavulina sp. PMI_390]
MASADESGGQKPADSPRQFHSFPDGDIVLRSVDEVEFRVDSVILRRSSAFFADLLSLPAPPTPDEIVSSPIDHQDPEALKLTENSVVLDLLFRLIYYLDPEMPEIPDSEADKVSFLVAVHKLQITHLAVKETVARIYSTFSALRAWALAVKFHDIIERKAAFKRLLVDSVNVLAEVEQVEELDEISARAVLRLHRLQQKALTEAAVLLKRYPVACAKHDTAKFWESLRAIWRDRPFANDAYAESRCSDIVMGLNCDECSTQFRTRGQSGIRYMTRETVESLLRATIEEESEGAAGAR